MKGKMAMKHSISTKRSKVSEDIVVSYSLEMICR